MLLQKNYCFPSLNYYGLWSSLSSCKKQFKVSFSLLVIVFQVFFDVTLFIASIFTILISEKRICGEFSQIFYLKSFSLKNVTNSLGFKRNCVNLLIFLEIFHYFFYIVFKFEAIFHQCFYNLVVLSNVSPIHAQFLLV
jgi:hypothetical protein